MELKPPKRSLRSIRANSIKDKLGCIKEPLFDMELAYVVANELHLLLRIMDVVIQALLDTAVVHDHHAAQGFHRRRVKAQDGPMVQKLVETIQSCKINFYAWEDKEQIMHFYGHLCWEQKKHCQVNFPSSVSQQIWLTN